MRSQRRFTIEINEAAFFHEPWLMDTITGSQGDTRTRYYRYDKVPPRIQKAFAQECRERGRMTPEEARMIIEFVINRK